jgi:hypothetical protein
MSHELPITVERVCLVLDGSRAAKPQSLSRDGTET